MSIQLDKEFNIVADRAIESWGEEAQMDMMIEECAELIVELIKRKRNSNGSTTRSIITEFVDVELMLGQMKRLFDDFDDIWKEEREYKLNRLKERLGI